jgi:ubiquinone/menaquinone biosynthesis C-methylase UbiE
MNKNKLIYSLILLIIIIFTSINYNINDINNIREDFIQLFDNYDETYVKLYNKVFNNIKLHKYNVNLIEELTINDQYKKNNVKILEAGCGNGMFYKCLNEKYNTIGVDRSESFIKQSKLNNPGIKFIHGDLKDSLLFDKNSFTHITCLFDTLYHNYPSVNINLILSNFNKWLKKDGYLCIHFFNKNKLDPAPREFSQYFYDTNNIKHSLTYFKYFSHDSWWIINKNKADFHEKYIFENGDKKIKIHNFNFPNKNKLIKTITNNNFKLYDFTDYKKIEIYDINLYIFKKI